MEDEAKLLSAIFEVQSGLVVVLDLAGRIIKFNGACESLTGYSSEEVKNKKIWDLFIIEEEMEDVKNTFDSLKDKDFPLEYKNYWQTKDGELRLISWSNNVILDNQEEIEYIVATGEDITAQKRTKEELKDISNIIESSPIVLLKWKREDWVVEFVSKNIEQFGYTQKELYKKEVFFSDIIYEDDLKEIKEEIKTYSQKGRDRFKKHYRILTAEGETRWIDNWIIIVRDDKGEVNHYYGIIIDVTERVKAEQKIRANEKRWKFALESSNYGIWDWNLAQDRVYFSKIWKEMLGYQEEEVGDRLSEWKSRVHPADLEEAMAKVKRHLAGAVEYYQDEHRMKHKDGHYIWIKDQGKVVEWTADGEPLRFIGTHEDITEQKEMKEELRKNEERYRELVEAQQDLIIRVDREGKFTYVNQVYCETFNKTEQELLGSSYSPRVFEGDIGHSVKAIEELMGSSSKVYFEQRMKTVDGWRWIAWEDYAIRDEGGEIIEVQGVGRDITELKEAQKEAEAANEAKSRFLANMSHEIRTPLNAVIGFSELLEEKIEGREEKNNLQSIKKAGSNLLSLVNDILDLSKIEAGELEVDYNYFDLEQLLRDMKEIFSQKVEQKGLSFILEIRDELPLLNLDKQYIRQMMINLISNAVKFMEHGYVKVVVEIEKRKEDLDLVLEVVDTGIGISSEKMDKIFASFCQEDNSLKREYEGTGLGLAITKHLVEMMEGEISLESKVGEGSTFRLEFVEVEWQEKEDETESKVQEFDFDSARILVVDDIQSNRKLLKSILTHEDLEVIMAGTGQSAVRLATEKEFDLILLDLKLPDIDGYRVLEEIKSTELNQDTPSFALTASATKDEIKNIKESCFNDFMTKPLKKQKFLDLVSNHLDCEVKEVQEKDLKIEDITLEEVELSVDEVQNLLTELEAEVLPYYEKLSKTFIINEVEEFIVKLQQLAIEYELEFLVDYTEELKYFTTNFELDRAKRELNKFKVIVNKLRSLL